MIANEVHRNLIWGHYCTNIISSHCLHFKIWFHYKILSWNDYSSRTWIPSLWFWVEVFSTVAIGHDTDIIYSQVEKKPLLHHTQDWHSSVFKYTLHRQEGQGWWRLPRSWGRHIIQLTMTRETLIANLQILYCKISLLKLSSYLEQVVQLVLNQALSTPWNT